MHKEKAGRCPAFRRWCWFAQPWSRKLRSMRERALLIGAALAIKQALPNGVEVRLEVPAVQVVQPVGVS